MKHIILCLLFLLSFKTRAGHFVVEAKYVLPQKLLKQEKHLKILPFTHIQHPYFSRLYTVNGQVLEKDLVKRPWVRGIEKTFEIAPLSLLPSENPIRLIEDELFPYQWSLLNQGQIYIREKDDIHNLPLRGLEGMDIGWKDISRNLPSKRVVVAVLDSGVDLNHPELVKNLWRNEKECGQDPKVDHDNNKLAGDCHGWNFTEAIDSDEAKVPQDFDSHGTHVAGIIAAAQNGFGISGVNPNAVIMPVKVMKDANSKSEVASSESFAQGIIYATNMGADIINLSLGWPRSLETKHLREAISYALSQNVIIVAAAGNNNSSEPLFPCAYDGVICTAASSLDGEFAGFSNYGGHIDAMVPGEGILSLNPTQFEPEFFAVTGFDIKSGTSQASPLLAGMLSILKSQEPSITLDEIYARLYALPVKQDSKKYILGGATNFTQLLKPATGPVIRPIFKRVRQIVLNGNDLRTKLIIPIRNYGAEALNLQVKLESLNDSIKATTEILSISGLKSSEVKELPFSIEVTNLSAESLAKIKVTIIEENSESSFTTELPIVRDIRSEILFKKFPFSFFKDALPLGSASNGRLAAYLNTVESYSPQDRLQEYFLKKTLKDERRMELTFFRKTDLQVVQVRESLRLENAQSLINLIRVDLNFDGKSDYVIQTLNEDQKGKFLEFRFLNNDFTPLWTPLPQARVVLDVGVSSLNDLYFTQLNHPTLGKILVPTFFTEGQIPKEDQVKDFYGRFDTTKENRLYQLVPQITSKELHLKLVSTQSWRDQLKINLKSNWNESVILENILPLSATDILNQQVRLLVSVGNGSKRKILIASFNGFQAFNGKTLPQLVLQTENVTPLYSTLSHGVEVVGESYLNVYDRARSKIVITKNEDQVTQFNYEHNAQTDLIVGHLASFLSFDGLTSIIQTRDELVSLTQNGDSLVKASRPKLRYSFFSSKVLSEMYQPVSFKREGLNRPALYVDSTAVTANRIYLFELQKNSIISSIQNSIAVPANCKALNPAFDDSIKNFQFVFLCSEGSDWILRTYEMN